MTNFPNRFIMYSQTDWVALIIHKPFVNVKWLVQKISQTVCDNSKRGFGWAKPVPVDPRYFRRPKQGMALTALAGPASNFLLALVLLFAGRLVYDYALYSAANQRLLTFLLTTAILSLGLGLFNLIPIPPLDGSKVLFSLLPDRAYNPMLRYERYGMLLLWAVVLLGVGDKWMSAAIQWTYELFCRVVGF